MTVFISLLLVAVLTFISVICETVRIRGCRICAAVLTDAAAESVMAAYDRPMLDQLGIFGHYCSDTTAAAQTVSDEIQRMLSPEQEYVLPRRSDFYRLHLQQAECTECTYLTDQGGKAFYEQAVCFMKDQAPAHMLAFLKNYAEGSQSTEELEAYYKNEEKSIEDKTNEYLEEAAGPFRAAGHGKIADGYDPGTERKGHFGPGTAGGQKDIGLHGVAGGLCVPQAAAGNKRNAGL